MRVPHRVSYFPLSTGWLDVLVFICDRVRVRQVCRSYRRLLLISSSFCSVAFVLCKYCSRSLCEQSRMHCRSSSFFPFKFGTVSSNFGMCLFLACSRAVQWSMKCWRSSASLLHSSHVLSTSYWLNLCRLAWRVYVPVSSLAFIAAFSTSWGFEPTYL